MLNSIVLHTCSLRCLQREYLSRVKHSRKKFFSSLYFLRAHTNKQFRHRHNCNFTLQLHICHFERRNYQYYIFHFYFYFFSRAVRCGLKFSLKKRSSSHFTQHISFLTIFLTTIFLYLIEKSFLQRLTIAIIGDKTFKLEYFYFDKARLFKNRIVYR